MILDTKFVELAILGLGLVSGHTDFNGNSTYAKADDNLLPLYSVKNYDEKYLSYYYAVRSELLSYTSLPRNWDGYTALSPKESHVELAYNLLRSVYELGLPMPRSQINSDGEISLYWRDDFRYMEVSVESDDTTSFYSKHRITKLDQFYDDLPAEVSREVANEIALIKSRKLKIKTVSPSAPFLSINASRAQNADVFEGFNLGANTNGYPSVVGI
jgi:hypothetical protein